MADFFFFFTKMLSPFIKEFIVFSTNQLQQLESQWAPTHTYYKNKLKMDQRPIDAKTIKTSTRKQR